VAHCPDKVRIRLAPVTSLAWANPKPACQFQGLISRISIMSSHAGLAAPRWTQAAMPSFDTSQRLQSMSDSCQECCIQRNDLTDIPRLIVKLGMMLRQQCLGRNFLRG